MDIIIQGIATLVIVIIAVLVFRYNHKKIKMSHFVISALLVALSIVLNWVSVMIPLFGFQTFKVSFEQLPIIFIGAYFGPLLGLISAFVSDTVSFVINPQGTYFAGFLLNRILVALIPALCFSSLNKLKPKAMAGLTYGALGALFLGSILFILTSQSITVSKQVIEITDTMRIGISLFSLAATAYLVTILTYFLKHQTDGFAMRFVVSMILIELVIQLIMTPLWLQTMYHVPYFLNFFVRVISATVLLLIKISIGLAVNRLFTKSLKSLSQEDKYTVN